MKQKEFFLSPLEGFLACDVDEAATPKYYGFQNVFGLWIIMKDNNGVLRYAYGGNSSADNYATNWTNRASLSYGLPADVFTDLQ